MHFATAAVVEDTTANDNTKLMENQARWKTQFYMTVSLLLKIQLVSRRLHL